MQEIDKALKQLALEMKRYPPQSRERRQAFTQLWQILIQNSARLCHPYRGQFSEHYAELYQQVLHQLCIYIWKNIDQYDPEVGEFLQWAANHKRMRGFFLKAYHEINPEAKRGLRRLSLNQLSFEFIPNRSQTTPSLSEEVIQYIEADPEGIFRATHTKIPEANFQFIVLKRVKEGYSWQDISEALGGIPISSLSSFYQRSLKKFAPLFRDYFSN